MVPRLLYAAPGLTGECALADCAAFGKGIGDKWLASRSVAAQQKRRSLASAV